MPIAIEKNKTGCAENAFHGLNTFGMSSLDFPELTLKQEKETINGRPVEVIRFEGRITNSNSFDINRKIYRIFDNNNYDMILDLSKLEYINSSGVAMLFSIFYRIKEKDGKFAIGGVHPFLYNVFSLMDLPPRLELYDTLDEARKAFVK